MKHLKLAATAFSLISTAVTSLSVSAQNSPAYTQQKPGYNIPGSPGSDYYTGTSPGSNYYAAPSSGNTPTLPQGMHQFGKGGNGAPAGYATAPAPLPAHAGGYSNPNQYKSKNWSPTISPSNQPHKWHPGEHIPRPYVPAQGSASSPSTYKPAGTTSNTGVGPGGAYSGSGGSYNYPSEQKKADFDTWAAVQQKGSHAPGPQRVPPGGYIPVMKDNKARKYFQGF